MSFTHISLNPHFHDLPEEVKNIEKYVFLHKELNFYIAKRRYTEEQIAFCVNEDLKRELKDELQEIEEHIRFVQEQIPNERVKELHFVIYAYMKVYRLTFSELAKQSGVSIETVRNSLQNGFQTEESKRLAIWSIRTFRLDANLYLHHFYN